MKRRKTLHTWMQAAVICCGLLVAAGSTASAKKKCSLPEKQKIAVIDAGSSGSRLHVYEVYRDSTVKMLFPVTEQEWKDCRGRALSTVANHPDSVKAYISTMTAKYPYAVKGDTIPLYVLATAGMRLQPQASTEGVYEKMKKAEDCLHGFKLKKAMTISGRYEGLYAWIADNYSNNNFATTTRGIIEVGGASMQITFASKSADIPEAQKLIRPQWGVIYSKSYLGGGMNQIYIHTPKTEPYKFSLPLQDVSSYIGNTGFYGCDNFKRTLKAANPYGSLDNYIKALGHDDPADKHHQYMMCWYMKWLMESFHIADRISMPELTPEWSEGAVYDILINREEPEAFDYDKVL